MNHRTKFIREPAIILHLIPVVVALGIQGCASPRFSTQSDDASVRPEIAIPNVTPAQVIDHLIAAKESRGCKVESQASHKVVIVCVEDRSKQSFGSWIASMNTQRREAVLSYSIAEQSSGVKVMSQYQARTTQSDGTVTVNDITAQYERGLISELEQLKMQMRR